MRGIKMTDINVKKLIVNGKEVEFTDEPNLLEVIKKAGFNVPTFCKHHIELGQDDNRM